MPYLYMTVGPNEGSRHELREGEYLIGRHPDCHIVVSVGAASRQHAKVVCTGDRVTVEDLGSRNGTHVNGKLLSREHVLSEGDQLRICEVEYRFQSDAAPAFLGPESSNRLMDDSPSGINVMLVDDGGGDTSAPSGIEIVRDASGTVRVDAGADVKLAALLEISRSLGGRLVLDEVFPSTLESLFRIFPQADRGFIVLETSDGKLIPRWAQTRRADDQDEAIRISSTIIRQVMNSREPMISLDAASDDRFEMSESIADFRIRSMICTPLLDAEGEAFGALQIDTMDQKNRFSEKETDLLQAVAVQVAVAIRNAKLHEQTMQQAAVEQDLQLANDVQSAFLPGTAPSVDEYEFHSFYRAAHHIGGDYFDYIHLDDGRIGIVIADVVGHGVAAAMYMAKLSAETRFCLASEADPAIAIARLNQRMSALPVEQFVTFLLIVLDPNSHSMTIVNAGHMPPIVLATDGTLSEPGEEESGVPIAVIDDMDYESVTVPIKPGDMAVMYTDGINEAMDKNDEEFGMQCVRAAVMAGGSAQDIGNRILSGIEDFAAGAAQFDDMCIVIMGRKA